MTEKGTQFGILHWGPCVVHTKIQKPILVIVKPKKRVLVEQQFPFQIANLIMNILLIKII